MIPNITRGSSMAGLVVYLAGPGRFNEHSDQHVVAGDDAVMAWHSDEEMSRDSALVLARHVELPKKVFDVDVKQGHVWHCSLSLRPEEGSLSDETWREIATDFVSRMDFGDAEGTKAQCRWVAVRHGLTKNGGDHIHIAVNLVREDGTKWYKHRDFGAAQKVCRELEEKYGLEPVEGPGVGRSTRGYDQAERYATARAQAQAKYESEHVPDRPLWDELVQAERDDLVARQLSTTEPKHVLATKVRGCAAASESEAEFVRRMRRAGVSVRPRYAAGTTDVVTGYSVADRSQFGEQRRFHAGGYLGRDLTLSRLRQAWADTPQAATAAAAEWSAAMRGKPPVARGREMAEPSAEEWKATNKRLDEMVDLVRTIPVDQRAGWSRIAGETAGALSALSHAVEDGDGPIGEAAVALSRSAQTYRHSALPERVNRKVLGGAAALAAGAAALRGKEAAAQVILLRSLMRLAQAAHDASRADHQAQQAAHIKAITHTRLVEVREAAGVPRARIDAYEAEMRGTTLTARQMSAPTTGRSPSPLPTTMRPRTSVETSQEAGIER